MTTPFKDYINMVGRGQRAGKTLSQQQAYDAMSQILQGKVLPEQLGAFLMLLRVREETAEELAGFTQACREYVEPEFSQIQADLDIGCYAGKRRHLPWFMLAIMALGQSGIKITIHGTSEPDSNRLYIKEALAFFGFTAAKSAEQVEQQLNQFGFSYLDLATIHPKLDDLIQLRALFGLRSPANTLARMLNPFKANHSLHGVHHRNFDLRHVAAAQLCNDEHVVCFRGEGGEVEFNPERKVLVHSSRSGVNSEVEMPALLEGWQIKPRELNLAELKQFWLNEIDNPYGEQAVIGTMAIVLILLKQFDAEEALTQAKTIWQSRSSTWPFDKN